MGKKKNCPNCGKEFKDSRKQKFERGSIIKLLKLIKVAGINEQNKKLKPYCFDCWKKEMRSMMKPYAEQLGKDASDW